MKTVLIHIGTWKTGTTSIQEALARGQELGSLRPVRYPMPEGSRDHEFLVTRYLPYERLPRATRSAYSEGSSGLDTLQRRYSRQLFDQLREADDAILSSESLASLHSDEIRCLRGDLEAAGYGCFLVVLYVRDPADYYLSYVQQTLKASSEVLDPVHFRYRFREIAEAWECVFPGDVSVHRYCNDSEFDVVQDFSAIVRERFDIELPAGAARLNQTISAEGMAVLQRYRASFWCDADDVLTPDTHRLVSWMRQLSNSGIKQTTPVLKPEIRDRIRTNHVVDAELIRDRYGVDLGLSGMETAIDPDLDGSSQSRVGRNYRVEDILAGLDSDAVTQLLLLIAKYAFERDVRKPAWVRGRVSRALRRWPALRAARDRIKAQAATGQGSGGMN